MTDMGQQLKKTQKQNQRIRIHMETVNNLSLQFKFVFTGQKIFYKLCYEQRSSTLKLIYKMSC